MQREFEHQSVEPGQTLSFTLEWAPPAPGSYHISVGAFADGWSPKYGWEESAASVEVP